MQVPGQRAIEKNYAAKVRLTEVHRKREQYSLNALSLMMYHDAARFTRSKDSGQTCHAKATPSNLSEWQTILGVRFYKKDLSRCESRGNKRCLPA